MGFRSVESMRRRAEKRGVTLSDQRDKDDSISRVQLAGEEAEAAVNKKASIERQKTATTMPNVLGEDATTVKKRTRDYMGTGPDDPTSSRPTSPSVRPTRPPATSSSRENGPMWTCSKCSNENRMTRMVCNGRSCEEKRPAALATAPGAVPNPGVWMKKDVKGMFWICGGCGNNNFLQREGCNTHGCEQRRPADAAGVSKAGPNFKQRRLNKAGEKTKGDGGFGVGELVWSEQAGPERIEYNMKVKVMYKETKGEGMKEEDVQRARVLIERDERKAAKKEKKVGKKGGNKKAGNTAKPNAPASAAKPAAKPEVVAEETTATKKKYASKASTAVEEMTQEKVVEKVEKVEAVEKVEPKVFKKEKKARSAEAIKRRAEKRAAYDAAQEGAK